MKFLGRVRCIYLDNHIGISLRNFSNNKKLSLCNSLKELSCPVEQSLKVAFFFSFEKKSSVRGKGGHVFLKGKCAAQKRFQLH
jgi:hypothetical protein